MKPWGLTLFCAALVAFAPSKQARAADAPILSMRRVSFATGADHKWYTDGARGWQAGIFGAYNLTPHLSLVGSSLYDFNAKGLEHKVGLRLRIWRGAD